MPNQSPPRKDHAGPDVRAHRRTSCARPGSVGGMSTTAYRTLADQLRGWPVERLSRLLHLRPDLATPAPHDSGQLASRAATRSSVLRALDQLNRSSSVSLMPSSWSAKPAPTSWWTWCTPTPTSVHAALERLLDLALAWESPQGLRPLTTVAEALRRVPRGQRAAPGLARPIDRGRGRGPARRPVPRRPGDCSSTSSTPAARRPPEPPGTPCCPRTRAPPPRSCWRTGCWCPAAAAAWCFPARSGWRCAVATPPRPPSTSRPRSRRPSVGQALVDRAAAGAAFEAVHRVELMLDQWGAATARGPAQRRSRRPRPARPGHRAARRRADRRPAGRGRLGRRAAVHRRRTRRRPALDPDRRLRRLDGSADRRALVGAGAAWLESPRLPGLVGSRDPAGKTWNALVPELSGVHQVETRLLTLGVAGRSRARHGAGDRHRRTVAAPARRVAAAAPSPHPRRPGGVGGRGGHLARAPRRWAGWRRTPGPCSPATATPRPPRSPSCCPHRSTTCCSRPT